MMGEGQPLPQSDEVLVCNTDTTLDEASNHIIYEPCHVISNNVVF